MVLRSLPILAALAAAPAAAQELSTVPLDCETTPGGVQCRVAVGDTASLLYCVAYGADDVPVANTTVSGDEGIAVLNGVTVEEIAGLRCRVE